MPRQTRSLLTRRPLLSAFVLLTAALVACDANDSREPVAPPTPPPPTPVAVSLSISPHALTIDVGYITSFSVYAVDNNSRPVQVPIVEWTSENPTVATVGRVNGMVTGVGEGVTTITAASGALRASATLTVRRPVPAIIRLSSTELIMPLGDSDQLTAEVWDNIGRLLPLAVQWTSENPGIASVNSTGAVTANGVGLTKVIATTETLRAEAVIQVEGANFLAQWASAARASSQYDTNDWAAFQAVGQRNVLTCIEDSKAWASEGLNVEWLELEYAQPVRPVEIRIYEVWAPGSIVKVEVKDVGGRYHQVYSATPLGVGSCLRTLIIRVSSVTDLVAAVRITVDQGVVRDWNEIDAVRLMGYRQ